MLGQAAGYATSALGYLATAAGKPLLVKEIAQACDIPAPYLAKIINTLRHVGLVETQRGVGGGVTLARKPSDVSLYDIAELLADPICNRRCMLGVAACTDERACPAHRFWTEQRGTVIEFLKKTSIADIAAFETRRRSRAMHPGTSTVSLSVSAASPKK